MAHEDEDLEKALRITVTAGHTHPLGLEFITI